MPRTGGSGTSPTFTSLLQVSIDDAINAAITDLGRLTHTTSGVAAVGMGNGLLLQTEDAAGNTDEQARIASVWEDATSGSEDSAFVVQLRIAGIGLAEVLRISPTAGLQMAVSDAATVTITDALRIDHFTSGAAGVAYGVGILMRGEDSAGNTDEMGRLAAAWTDATATSEDSDFVFQLRVAGAALAEVCRISPTAGLQMAVSDAATVTTTIALQLDHFTSGAAGVAYGVGILMRGENAAGTTANMAQISAVWTDATAASEDSNVTIQTRTAGAVLATALTINTLTTSTTGDLQAGNGTRVGGFRMEITTTTVEGRFYSQSTSTTGLSGLYAENNNAGAITQFLVTGSAYATVFLGSASPAGSHNYFISNTGPITMGTIAAEPFEISTNNLVRARWASTGILVLLAGAAALGGGVAATLGTIGGAGPTVAGQNEWQRLDTANGTRWVPVWA